MSPGHTSESLSRRLRRRDFLRGAAQGAAALTAMSYSRVLGANDKIQLGVIGCGTRGMRVLGFFQKNSTIDVVAVCDVFGDRVDEARQKATAARPTGDHREVLERKDVDAVLIATPDHWHAAISIEALNAKKDVYVEKPLTLKIEEGPEIVKAARVNERVCQAGMQQRSGRHYLRAKEEIFDAGKLGKLTLARTWWHGNGFHLRRAPASLQNKPANLDWDRFLGPLKWREYDPQQFYNWRAYLDFGGGQVTDLFTHWIDVVHMFTGDDVPISAVAAGGVYNYKDGRTAPDTISILLEYPTEFTATFDATLAPGIDGEAVEFCGTEGRLLIDREHFEFHSADEKEPAMEVDGDPAGLVRDHVNNFIDCLSTRKRPNGDVLIGHRSAQASHLGTLAYLNKRRLAFDPIRERIVG